MIINSWFPPDLCQGDMTRSGLSLCWMSLEAELSTLSYHYKIKVWFGCRNHLIILPGFLDVCWGHTFFTALRIRQLEILLKWIFLKEFALFFVLQISYQLHTKNSFLTRIFWSWHILNMGVVIRVVVLEIDRRHRCTKVFQLAYIRCTWLKGTAVVQGLAHIKLFLLFLYQPTCSGAENKTKIIELLLFLFSFATYLWVFSHKNKTKSKKNMTLETEYFFPVKSSKYTFCVWNVLLFVEP